MNGPHSIRFEITPSFIDEAFRLHQSTVIAGYRVLAVLIAAAGVVLAVAGMQPIGVGLAFAGVLLLLTTWARPLDRWLYSRGNRGLVGTTCQYDFDDQGIQYATALGTGLLPWSSLTEIRANERVIVFRRDRYMAASAPTSAFASRAECTDFLVSARARLTEGQGTT
jgi:hypothetical protein